VRFRFHEASDASIGNQGWFIDDIHVYSCLPPDTSWFTGVATARAFDGTVSTTPVPIQIAGTAGVPSNATAVVVNTEVFQPSAAGYVRVTHFSSDASVAVQEFTAGQTISNLVTVKLVNGKIQAKVSAGTARVLMDMSGYYSDGSGSSFTGCRWRGPSTVRSARRRCRSRSPVRPGCRRTRRRWW